jgi:hypothetical protein
MPLLGGGALITCKNQHYFAPAAARGTCDRCGSHSIPASSPASAAFCPGTPHQIHRRTRAL